MNLVRYYNPKTGEHAAVRVTQSKDVFGRINKPLSTANRTMLRRGFVRAGGQFKPE